MSKLIIDRKAGPPIVIGQRITFGAIIGGIFGFLLWVLEVTTGIVMPAIIAVPLTAALIGLAQVFIVHKFGVTTPDA